MQAALFVNGRVVTGLHHGEAYGKLRDDERNLSFRSGFYDSKQCRFCDDQQEFYLKKIIMVRHADAERDQEDPGITEKGRQQIEQASFFISSFVNLTGFVGFTSPKRRCQETAALLSNQIAFEVSEKFEDTTDRNYLKTLLAELPPKTILVSHCNLISHLAQLATGMTPRSVDNCSITFIENCTATFAVVN